MSECSLLRGFARNNALANLRLYMAMEALAPGEYEATRVSFFPSLRLTLEHLYLVDIYYFDALVAGGRGRTVAGELDTLSTFAALRDAQRRMDQRLLAFVDGLSEADLAREVRIERVGHDDVETIADVLPHLFEHQIHHRGQVHAMLSGSSVKPPQIDEYFLAVDRPAADRELAALADPARIVR